MIYLEYILQKFRKALGEHSASAFLAGTKALAERNCLRTCQEDTRRTFGECSSFAFLAGTKALAECSPSAFLNFCKKYSK